MAMHTGTGNLLEAPAEALVNTVNCVGAMGKGIALQFKKAWPAMFEAYRRAARAGEVIPGRMHVYETTEPSGPRLIINFPTKRHWRQRSRMEDIDAGLVDLLAVLRAHDVRSVAIPPLGAGLGGLPWPAVRARIAAAFEAADDVDVWLWEPGYTPPADARPVNTVRPTMTGPRAMILALMGRFRVMDHEATHLDVQKLAYFLQRAGAPLSLSFEAQRYGPYADGLYHMLQRLEGHHISGLVDRRPFAPLRLLPGTVSEAEAFFDVDRTDLAPFERVTRLIEGFETPYGMELLATVHWVATERGEAEADFERCLTWVRDWSPDKAKRLEARHVRLAWQRLVAEGWIGDGQAAEGAA